MNDLQKPSAIVLRWLLFPLLLIALPLLGVIATGSDPSPYLEFPPTTRYVQHAGFSWAWFAFFTIADLLLIGGLLFAVVCGKRRIAGRRRLPPQKNRMPWWGWAGLSLCLTAWFMAWKRYTWFWLFQPHTFLPIWAGFILFINGLSVRRHGSCLLLRRPLGFILLFPASAAFWWVFEYFNRFVQNWYYTGIEGMGAGEYSYYSSLAFASVLPGVFSMIDLLLTFPALGNGLARCTPVKPSSSRIIPLVVLISAAVGLSLIGIFPDQLFALLWVSPPLIVICLQWLSGRPTMLHPLRRGDWRPLIVPALAALICGFFWEMWNYFSLARWTYVIPFVQRFHLFEMPILGYGGYLPFGLTCLAAGTPVIGNAFEHIRED